MTIKLKSIIRGAGASFYIGWGIRAILALCIPVSLILHDFHAAFMFSGALALTALPFIAELIFRFRLPPAIRIIAYVFIVAAIVGGEILNLYTLFPAFDSLLHTLTGFTAAGIGFGLLCMTAEKRGFVSLITPALAAGMAICFSMTVAVGWEFFEYTGDSLLKMNMQKDRTVTRLSSTELDKTGTNTPVKLENIGKTVIYNTDGEIICTVENGFLEKGITDTMLDMAVNLAGALAFALPAALYTGRPDKYRFASYFIFSPRIKKTKTPENSGHSD